MSVFAITCGRYDRQTARGLSTWAKGFLSRTAIADLTCSAVSVFAAVQIHFNTHAQISISL